MSKINEAINILKVLGLPRAQQNERSALTLLALLDLKENDLWSNSKDRLIRIHDILSFIQKEYGKRYAENTRETIRRQTLHQFIQAGLVIKNFDDPLRSTNSPNTNYIIAPEALYVIKTFNTKEWKVATKDFIKNKGKLIDKYNKIKAKHLLNVRLPSGDNIKLSPGKHNKLQKQIIEDFRLRFCPNAIVLYVGDSARKKLYINEKNVAELCLPISTHGKLPDVVLYDKEKNIVFLIESVTSHGPLSPKRQIELEEILKNCKANRTYISAFPDFKEFKRHLTNIAWETEVWIYENPDHLIHYNGDKFFTIYK